MSNTLKKKKRKKQKAIQPCVGAEAKQRVIRPFWCEFQREQNTEKRELQLEVQSEEIERNTVRV